MITVRLVWHLSSIPNLLDYVLIHCMRTCIWFIDKKKVEVCTYRSSILFWHHFFWWCQLWDMCLKVHTFIYRRKSQHVFGLCPPNCAFQYYNSVNSVRFLELDKWFFIFRTYIYPDFHNISCAQPEIQIWNLTVIFFALQSITVASSTFPAQSIIIKCKYSTYIPRILVWIQSICIRGAPSDNFRQPIFNYSMLELELVNEKDFSFEIIIVPNSIIKSVKIW